MIIMAAQISNLKETNGDETDYPFVARLGTLHRDFLMRPPLSCLNVLTHNCFWVHVNDELSPKATLS